MKKSQQASKNRKTEVEGEGAGPSRHTGGSIKFAEHARRMVSLLVIFDLVNLNASNSVGNLLVIRLVGRI